MFWHYLKRSFLSFYNSHPENDFDDYFPNEKGIFNGDKQKRGILSNDDLSNLAKKDCLSLFLIKNETKTNRETNLTELISNKPKLKIIFEVKKETSKGNKCIKDIPPEFFNEKSINDIIEQFYIIEVKLNVLMDIDNKNNEINKLRQMIVHFDMNIS